MSLEKLTITPYSLKNRILERSQQLEEIKVLFNPTSYSITKPISWQPTRSSHYQGARTERQFNAPRLQFAGGGSRILTLELFFDVTEPNTTFSVTDLFNVNPASLLNIQPLDDVRLETNKIVALTRIERDSNQPPVCVISWGNQIRTRFNSMRTESDFPFTGVITNLVQNFTLFKRNGNPVRANLTVTFTEFLDPEEDKRKTDPEVTSHLIKRGDTLSSIAQEVYSDSTQWRIIAEANQIDDPRALTIGQSLTIPQLI